MPAHDLLRAWFVRSRTKVSHAADKLGVSRQTVHAWLNGAIPSPSSFGPIAELTDGAVPADAWFVMGWETTPEGRACFRKVGLRCPGL